MTHQPAVDLLAAKASDIVRAQLDECRLVIAHGEHVDWQPRTRFGTLASCQPAVSDRVCLAGDTESGTVGLISHVDHGPIVAAAPCFEGAAWVALDLAGDGTQLLVCLGGGGDRRFLAASRSGHEVLLCPSMACGRHEARWSQTCVDGGRISLRSCHSAADGGDRRLMRRDSGTSTLCCAALTTSTAPFPMNNSDSDAIAWTWTDSALARVDVDLDGLPAAIQLETFWWGFQLVVPETTMISVAQRDVSIAEATDALARCVGPMWLFVVLAASHLLEDFDAIAAMDKGRGVRVAMLWFSPGVFESCPA